MELPERVEALSDAACEVWEAVAESGWSALAASDTLATVDALVDALARIGPEFAEVLAPALAATAAARALLARCEDGSEDGSEATGPRGAARTTAGPAPAGRHTVPEFWITRNMVVAEQLWWGEQEGRGGPLAEMFAALPPRAMEEAVTRRLAGEVWQEVLEDLILRHTDRTSPPHRLTPS
ncbi:hypothetical protein ACOZGD_37475 [Streptomyces murinus]